MPPPLPDRYGDLELIGEGGFGFVYRARDLLLNRSVAVKVAKARDDQSAEVRNLLTEAQRAARLHHPNVITVFDLAFHDERLLLSMEYAPGGTLADRLKAHGRLDADEVARRVHEVAQGLAYAHEQGVIHRDVKPSNLLVGALDATKVADFGLSREIDRSTTHLAGTPAYMAPEQFNNQHRLTPAADVFALAVTAYELLTGTRHGGLPALVGGEPPRPISEVVNGIDPAVDDVLTRALDLNEAGRTSSVTRLADELAEAIAATPRQSGPSHHQGAPDDGQLPADEMRDDDDDTLDEVDAAVFLIRRVDLQQSDGGAWFVGVNWLGGSPAACVAFVTHARLVRLETGLGANDAARLISAWADKHGPVVVGMNFGFSLPGWSVDTFYEGSARRLWESMSEYKWDSGQGSPWHMKLPPPFWGTGIRPRSSLPAEGRWLRETEVHAWHRTGIEPQSTLHLTAPDSAGGHNVRGMAELAGFQDAGWQIWPFDPPGQKMILEVMPRALWQPHARPKAALSDDEARAALTPTICDLLEVDDAALRRSIAGSQSAFEAVFTAWSLSDAAPALPDLSYNDAARREGWIWLPDELPV